MFEAPNDLQPMCLLCCFTVVSAFVVFNITYDILKKKSKTQTTLSEEAIYRRSLSTAAVYFVLLCILVTLFDSCVGFGPYPILKPANQDIIGIWHLSPDSVQYLQSKGYTVVAHELVFQDSGTFYMSNIPNIWRRSLFGEQYITRSGTWSIQRHESWEIDAYFQTADSQINDTVISFSIVGRMPPYTLFTWVDTRGVVFERE